MVVRRVPQYPLLLAVISAFIALATVVAVVPRIRWVEAITLFATAFAAGAGFATTLSRSRDQIRRRANRN